MRFRNRTETSRRSGVAAPGALPFVSVLIPTYNHEKYIARSIESALAQIYPSERMELIVVDDASTDGTEQAVAPYLDRVTYIRQPRNGGVISTFNTLYGTARGDFMAVQPGDDLAPISRLAIQVEALLRQPNVGLHFGDMTVIDGDDRVLTPSFFRKYGITPRRGRPTRELLRGNFVAGGTIMVRREALEHFWPLPPEAGWEDWYMGIRISEEMDLDFTEQQISGYRLHATNYHHGAEGERGVRARSHSVPLYRWMAAEVRCEDATDAEWLEILDRFLREMKDLNQNWGVPVDELAPRGPERERASEDALRAAARHWARGEATLTTRQVVAAVAQDPRNEAARLALAFLTDRPEMAPPERWEARGFVTIANAAELLVDSAPLAAYAERFTDADDASLVLAVHPDATDRLLELLASLELTDPGAAHVVVEPLTASFGDAAAGWAGHVQAVLTADRATAALPVHLHAGVESVDELYELAARRFHAA